MEYCLRIVHKSAVDEGRYDRVWREVHELKDAYEMNP
jgi:hypothetical protein